MTLPWVFDASAAFIETASMQVRLNNLRERLTYAHRRLPFLLAAQC